MIYKWAAGKKPSPKQRPAAAPDESQVMNSNSTSGVQGPPSWVRMSAHAYLPAGRCGRRRRVSRPAPGSSSDSRTLTRDCTRTPFEVSLASLYPWWTTAIGCSARRLGNALLFLSPTWVSWPMASSVGGSHPWSQPLPRRWISDGDLWRTACATWRTPPRDHL